VESVCSGNDSFNLMQKLDALFKTQLIEGSQKVFAAAPHLTYDDWVSHLFRDLAELPPFTVQDHAPWENIGVAPAKYNRMVVYPTWQLHGVAQLRDKPAPTRDTARLTLNTFIKHPALEQVMRVPVAPIEGLDAMQPFDGARRGWP
jgi:hypothetical protein